MGKTQKKCKVSTSRNPARVDPLGRPVAPGDANGKGGEEEEDLRSQDELVQRISVQLQDASAETKECGLQSLSQLVLSCGINSPAEQVLACRLVRVTAPLMAEQAHANVRHAATGALRNLSLVSAEVCDEMVKQDVMTPLCALLSTYADADLTPAATSPSSSSSTSAVGAAKKKSTPQPSVIDSKSEIFVEAVHLLWNLCEANPTALAVFNREGLVVLLIKHLTSSGCVWHEDEEQKKFPTKILLPVLQCLYSATEDNPESHEMVRQNIQCLEDILALNKIEGTHNPPDIAYVRILALGVLLNVGEKLEDSERFHHKIWPLASRIISRVLDVDQRKMCNDYTSQCPLLLCKSRNGELTDSMEEGETEEEKLESIRDDLNNTIQAQQTALEILTNLCCGDDDDGEESSQWEDEDESDQSDDTCLELSNADDVGLADTSAVLALPAFVTEIIRSEDLVRKVLEKANLPAENVCQIMRENPLGKKVLKMLCTLRSRAFLCLNNLVSTMTADDLGGTEGLFKTWSSLGTLCFKDSSVDVDLLESATSAMRAVTQSLLDNRCFPAFKAALTAEDVTRMLTVGAASEEARVRINVVQIAGAVGILLTTAAAEAAEADGGGAIAEMIATFLCEAAIKDVNLRVVSEALDKIFDMFGEDTTDDLCIKTGVVSRLRQVLPGLKAKIGMQRRTLSAEDYSMISMAKTNLARFIKYKEKRGIVK